MVDLPNKRAPAPLATARGTDRGVTLVSDSHDALSEGNCEELQVTLTDSERSLISVLLAGLVETIEDVPEIDLDELLELHSKFLMPSDIFV
jgi:hypothetical protein